MIKKSKYEKLFKILIIFFVVLTAISESMFSAYVESSEAQKQRLIKKINNQKSLNTGMEMKISELTSLDKSLGIAKEYGLSYNSNNIITIKR